MKTVLVLLRSLLCIVAKFFGPLQVFNYWYPPFTVESLGFLGSSRCGGSTLRSSLSILHVVWAVRELACRVTGL